MSGEHDFEDLVHELDLQIDDLANRVQAAFSAVVPETRQWNQTQREVFTAQARGRLNAILAVVVSGTQLDSALRKDLEHVGASSPTLSHLQLVLRISRDLLVQSAIDTRSDGLQQFLSRLLPTVDSLLDAVGHGYWNAQLQDARSVQHRLGALFEALPHPMYEVDIDGVIRHANAAFSGLFGSTDPTGRRLVDVIVPIRGNVADLLAEPRGDAATVRLTLGSPETSIPVEVDTIVHRANDEVSGFAGLIRFVPHTCNAGPAI